MNTKNLRRTLFRLIVFVVLIGLPAKAAPPVVKAVPWVAKDPFVPHPTYSGKTVTLKGTCDRSGDNLQWTWNFGDGSPPATGTVTDAYAVQATHAYTAPRNALFTARLTIQDINTGEITSRPYLVEVTPRTLEVEVNIAIDEGLWYLHKAQTRYDSGGVELGDWSASKYGGRAYMADYPACHAANINALLANGHAANGPATNPYSETVRRGLNGLFMRLKSISIGLQSHNNNSFNPDTNSNNIGIIVTDMKGYSDYSYYQAGIMMSAFVASGTPLAIAPTGGNNIKDRTYRDVVQDMVDACAWAQSDGVNGGGWRYSAHESPDNSASKGPAIGMIAAERVWGLTVPQWTKDWNLTWLAYSQNSQGWFGYTSAEYPPWGLFGATPSGMVQLAMNGVGRDVPGAPSWDKAETIIRDNFGNTGSAIAAIKSTYYGLFAFVESMLLHPGGPIEMLRSQTPGVSELDWYASEVSKGSPTDGVARTLVNDQSSSGYWWEHNWHSAIYPFETAWAVMMLNKTEFVNGRPVAVPKGTTNPASAGQIITLDGSTSFHQNGTRHIVRWDWDLGNDGTFDASGKTIATSFGTTGNFPVKLRVTDDSMPPISAVSTIYQLISTPPLAPSAVAGGPYVFYLRAKPWLLSGLGSINPDEGEHESACPHDTIKEYAWDLDGDRDFDDAFGPTPDVTDYFTNLGPGGYTVLVRVTDNTSQAFQSSTLPDLTSESYSQVFVDSTVGSETLTFNSGTAKWLLSGGGSAVSDVVFEQSIDGVNWIASAAATRIEGGWESTGISPSGDNWQLRARGLTTSGALVMSILRFGPDSDNDGLLDSWEIARLNTTDGHAAMDDHDCDGFVELLELAFGGNPLVPDNCNPEILEESGYLTFAITKQPGVTYTVEGATTLEGPWSAAQTTVITNNDTMLRVRYNFSTGSSPTGFMRVRVTSAP